MNFKGTPRASGDDHPGGDSSSRDHGFPMTEFLGSLWEISRPLLTLPKPGSSKAPYRKIAFGKYASGALDLELFLDGCAAKRNRVFSPLRDLVAGVRCFAKAGLFVTQLLGRAGTELSFIGSQKLEELVASSEAALSFVAKSLGALWSELEFSIGDLVTPGTALRRGNGAHEESEPAAPRFTLPATIDEATVPEQERRIAELGAKFLAHRSILKRQSDGNRFTDSDAMRSFVRTVSDEQEVRFFQTRIHNVRSAYDTWIQGTDVEREDPGLPRFRACVEAGFLILAAMTELVQFYERNECDTRTESGRERPAALVDRTQLLDHILNWALLRLHMVVDAAAPLAEGFVARYTRQATVVCTLPEGISFHARPVSLITRVVGQYGTPVKMRIGDAWCHAGSMLQLLVLIGSRQGERTVVFEGDRRTLDDLALLFEHGLGERGSGSLPPALAYLGI